MYLLGIDLGSSSVKASLVEITTGKVLSSASSPEVEMTINAPEPGYAEQYPDIWWENLKSACHRIKTQFDYDPANIKAIGIAYQMHGLVCLDREGKVLRPAIIWCDSRAVDIGEELFQTLGKEDCLSHLLNSPGNFTASKLKWVQRNEPEIFEKIDKVMLPGDYIAYRMSGEKSTTISGLSEAILWDFEAHTLSKTLLDEMGVSEDLIPKVKETFDKHGTLSGDAAAELGLVAGIPISYKAGDQPNNALSLNVFEPGEMAATAGTSGVVYAVSDKRNYDEAGRVNIFAHVNYGMALDRLGILLCVNGCGILNSFLRKTLKYDTYEEMNEKAAQSPIGSKGLVVLPFGNGAERMLGNQDLGGRFIGMNYNLHGEAEMLRAAQEGIAFALCYGMEVMQSLGTEVEVVRAGNANMFLSPLFKDAFVNTAQVQLEIYDTDGAKGAALGAGLGANVYPNREAAFANLKKLSEQAPDSELVEDYRIAYAKWKSALLNILEINTVEEPVLENTDASV